MRSFVLTALYVLLLMLQALLLSFASGNFDVVEQIRSIGGDSWLALILYAVLLGGLGAWCMTGRRSFKELSLGKRLIFAATIAGPLPLWIFFNGFLDDDLMEMFSLWVIPFVMLVVGASITKDWHDLVKAFVIGLGVPAASLCFFLTFVDFGN